MKITFVIPVYNERESLLELFAQLASAADALVETGRIDGWDVWFVDDGSDDGSRETLRSLATSHGSVHLAALKRNMGKSAALSTGFSLAEGDVVVTMDADLQDDPSELFRLIDKLDEGFDIVVGWKRVRHDSLEKRLASKVFNTVVSALTGVRLHDANSGYKAYRCIVVKTVEVRDGMHRFIPVLASGWGFKSGEVAVNHRPRKYGSSKYGAKRYVEGICGLCRALRYTKAARKAQRRSASAGPAADAPNACDWTRDAIDEIIR